MTDSNAGSDGNPFEMGFYIEDDPAASDADTHRDTVCHLTSGGTATANYGHSMVSLLETRAGGVRVDALRRLTFDFTAGPANTGAIPGEVRLLLLSPDDQFRLAVLPASWDVETGTWETFDVLDAIDSQIWNIRQLTAEDPRTNGTWLTTTRPLPALPDVTGVVGDMFGDSTVVGVGVGAGKTAATTVVDRYLDALVVEWHADDEADPTTARFDFPALVPLSVERVAREQERLTVSLSVSHSEPGLCLDDVVADTVELTAFSSVATPTAPGVQPHERRVVDGTLELTFRWAEVTDQLGETPTFLLTGEFDTPTTVSGFAVGDIPD